MIVYSAYADSDAMLLIIYLFDPENCCICWVSIAQKIN